MQTNLRRLVLTVVVLLTFLIPAWHVRAREAKPEPDLVSFPSGAATLKGFFYKPPGPGPFPAVLYNHGSDKLPGSFPALAKFWTGNGFVFFVPHRPGHGRSPGAWIVDQQEEYRLKEKDPARTRQHDVELHEQANVHVMAAAAWLRQQPFVQGDSVIMAGISYGGIQTVLAAEQDSGVRAYVIFSPGAMSWLNPTLRERLLKAVKNRKAPVFLLQAHNDYNLGPSELLGGELTRQGVLNRTQVYPAFGDAANPRDGHGGFAVRGSDVWGPDVLEFVNAVLKR